MEANESHLGRKIIFIHGQGDGVLRRAITTELDERWWTCEYAPAPEEQYGFGAAIVVTIRYWFDDSASCFFFSQKTAYEININAPEAIGKVFVYAMNGVTVANVAPAATSATISTANLAPGAYVVKVVTNGKTEAKRILVK